MNVFKRISLLLFFFTSLVFVAQVSAYGLGTSTIILNRSNVSLVSGQSFNLKYNVTLVTGNTWGTIVNVTNQTTLSKNGITIALNTGQQDPPYSGTASITVSSTAQLGIYKLAFFATGDDPTSNPTIFTLDIVKLSNNYNLTTTSTKNNTANTTSATVQSTSVPVTTTGSNPGGYVVTSVNTTPNTYNQTSSVPLYISIFAVIILFSVIIIRLRSL